MAGRREGQELVRVARSREQLGHRQEQAQRNLVQRELRHKLALQPPEQQANNLRHKQVPDLSPQPRAHRAFSPLPKRQRPPLLRQYNHQPRQQSVKLRPQVQELQRLQSPKASLGKRLRPQQLLQRPQFLPLLPRRLQLLQQQSQRPQQRRRCENAEGKGEDARLYRRSVGTASSK